ncbi:hypothetical protein ACFFRR_011094 [Megaselia abdita]
MKSMWIVLICFVTFNSNLMKAVVPFRTINGETCNTSSGSLFLTNDGVETFFAHPFLEAFFYEIAVIIVLIALQWLYEDCRDLVGTISASELQSVCQIKRFLQIVKTFFANFDYLFLNDGCLYCKYLQDINLKTLIEVDNYIRQI